jgi:hypothetical protein
MDALLFLVIFLLLVSGESAGEKLGMFPFGMC